MEIVIGIFVLAIGALIGFYIGKAKFYIHPIGDLRIDHSDRDDGPHLFLELDANVPAVLSQKYVAFRVKVEDFVSHE